jgi:predicted ATPase
MREHYGRAARACAHRSSGCCPANDGIIWRSQTSDGLRRSSIFLVDDRTLDLTPEKHRQTALEALMSQLAGWARQNPVLMIVEDAHWIDPSSLEVFGRTVHRIATLRVLLIVGGVEAAHVLH